MSIRGGTVPAQSLTTIGGGINRLRTKGGADKNSLYDLLNGYVTQANTIKVRPGTIRNANIAAYSGVGATKGLMAYQDLFHVFAAGIVPVPPGYELHVLNYPAFATGQPSLAVTDAAFAATTQIGTGSGYGLVSATQGYAVNAIINPPPFAGADVGSVSPAQLDNTNIVGFFQATSGSTHDANEVYLVVSGDAIPSAGVSVTYPAVGGPVTVNLTTPTTVLGLPAGYVAYALGTAAPYADPYISSVAALLSQSATDTSLNNSPVTVTGGIVTSGVNPPPNYQSGMSFPIQSNGTHQQYAEVGAPIPSTAVTIEFYINPTSGPEGNAGQTDILLDVNGAGETDEASHLIWVSSTSSITGALFNGGSVNIPYVPVNTWTHIALVVNGTTLYQFRNGTLVSTTSPTITSLGDPLYPYWRIGSTKTSAINNYNDFIGSIAGFRITTDVARYTAAYTPAVQPFPTATLPLAFVDKAPFAIKEIHFAAPYLGGIYVVAEFDVSTSLELTYGTVFHYWIESITQGSSENMWAANTDYSIGDVVIPTSPNGLTYIASRKGAANPLWTANTQEQVGNIVEPTIANGFKYTCTVTQGAAPSTGATEPTWPTADGAAITENSAIANDQTVTIAGAAAAVPGPSTPTRYQGLYTKP
jgi:hypothetical protein